MSEKILYNRIDCLADRPEDDRSSDLSFIFKILCMESRYCASKEDAEVLERAVSVCADTSTLAQIAYSIYITGGLYKEQLNYLGLYKIREKSRGTSYARNRISEINNKYSAVIGSALVDIDTYNGATYYYCNDNAAAALGTSLTLNGQIEFKDIEPIIRTHDANLEHACGANDFYTYALGNRNYPSMLKLKPETTCSYGREYFVADAFAQTSLLSERSYRDCIGGCGIDGNAASAVSSAPSTVPYVYSDYIETDTGSQNTGVIANKLGNYTDFIIYLCGLDGDSLKDYCRSCKDRDKLAGIADRVSVSSLLFLNHPKDVCGNARKYYDYPNSNSGNSNNDNNDTADNSSDNAKKAGKKAGTSLPGEVLFVSTWAVVLGVPVYSQFSELIRSLGGDGFALRARAMFPQYRGDTAISINNNINNNTEIRHSEIHSDIKNAQGASCTLSGLNAPGSTLEGSSGGGTKAGSIPGVPGRTLAADLGLYNGIYQQLLTSLGDIDTYLEGIRKSNRCDTAAMRLFSKDFSVFDLYALIVSLTSLTSPDKAGEGDREDTALTSYERKYMHMLSGYISRRDTVLNKSLKTLYSRDRKKAGMLKNLCRLGFSVFYVFGADMYRTYLGARPQFTGAYKWLIRILADKGVVGSCYVDRFLDKEKLHITPVLPSRLFTFNGVDNFVLKNYFPATGLSGGFNGLSSLLSGSSENSSENSENFESSKSGNMSVPSSGSADNSGSALDIFFEDISVDYGACIRCGAAIYAAAKVKFDTETLLVIMVDNLMEAYKFIARYASKAVTGADKISRSGFRYVFMVRDDFVDCIFRMAADDTTAGGTATGSKTAGNMMGGGMVTGSMVANGTSVANSMATVGSMVVDGMASGGMALGGTTLDGSMLGGTVSSGTMPGNTGSSINLYGICRFEYYESLLKAYRDNGGDEHDFAGYFASAIEKEKFPSNYGKDFDNVL